MDTNTLKTPYLGSGELSESEYEYENESESESETESEGEQNTPTIQIKTTRSGRVSKPPQSNELPENFHMLSPRERFLKDHRQSYFHEYYLWQMNPALFAK